VEGKTIHGLCHLQTPAFVRRTLASASVLRYGIGIGQMSIEIKLEGRGA